MIKFILLVNKQGNTRLSKYYEVIDRQERVSTEAEITRKCLAKPNNQCSFMEFRDFKIAFRRYASLYFIFGIDNDENELAILELIHHMVELLDKYFHKVCELDIMFNLEKAHMLIDEMITNGCIVETSSSRVLAPLLILGKSST